MSGFWGTWQNDYHYKAAALEFEARYGLSGIGRRYIMPPDHDMQSLEYEIRRRVQWVDIPMNERLKRAQGYADTLTALNPGLTWVSYQRQDLLDVWHFILGVTSGYNPDDIDYFINNIGRPHHNSHYQNDPGLKKLSVLFNNHAVAIQWRPSPKTVELIISKFLPKKNPLPPPSPPGPQ